MKWIGLTGGIASGKSTVAAIIEKNGIPVVNADHVAHQALDPGSEVYPKILQAFGSGIVHGDGSIDRNQLGALVFKDAKLREKLESIVHPFVKKRVSELRKTLSTGGHDMAVYDVPLLFEKNMDKDFDRILLVYCDPETQVQRVMARNSLTRDQAVLRIQSQIPLVQKKARADDIIENTKTLIDLEIAVQRWLGTL
jgi:dephospho-CoA kinase